MDREQSPFEHGVDVELKTGWGGGSGGSGGGREVSERRRLFHGFINPLMKKL